MAYCRKCGYHLDDFDSYCPNCGEKVENNSSCSNASSSADTNKNTNQDKRTTIEDSINNFTDSVSKNFESFVCLLCGILSLTVGTVICAIVSLVFAKKAVIEGQTEDNQAATFCKIGKICSIISIVLNIIGVTALIIYGICMSSMFAI